MPTIANQLAEALHVRWARAGTFDPVQCQKGATEMKLSEVLQMKTLKPLWFPTMLVLTWCAFVLATTLWIRAGG